jgi:uracil-DNA glycosylase family 4
MGDKKYVPGMGPVGAKIIILGEAPAREETVAGKPFVGPSGRELDRLLQDAGIRRTECWITNVCKYEVPPNYDKKKSSFYARAVAHGIDIDKQLAELQV